MGLGQQEYRDMYEVSVKYKMDKEDLEFFFKAKDFYVAVSNFDTWLRDQYKYKDVEYVSLYDVREKLYEYLEEYKVDFDILS